MLINIFSTEKKDKKDGTTDSKDEKKEGSKDNDQKKPVASRPIVGTSKHFFPSMFIKLNWYDLTFTATCILKFIKVGC